MRLFRNIPSNRLLWPAALVCCALIWGGLGYAARRPIEHEARLAYHAARAQAHHDGRSMDTGRA